MERRKVVAGLGAGTLVIPLRLLAQQQQKGYFRIGYLANDPDPRRYSQTFRAFLGGLQELGWIEGQNIEVHVKASGGRDDEFPKLVAELLRDRVDVIVTGGSAATRAARAATDTIPIVFGSAANPVEQKFVASLAQPGGNVTGLALLVRELGPKRLQVLKEILPKATRFARMYQVKSLASIQPSIMTEDDAAARKLEVSLTHIPVARFEDVEPAFAAAVKARVEAVHVTAAGVFVGNRPEVAKLALEYRVPLLGPDGRFADAGALVSYGQNYSARYRRAAYLVDKVLRGIKPADIPVEQPAVFELVVNLKTARQLGIDIPETVLLQADRTIR